ncbi:hypothetical protein ACFLUU_01075 [Chloroflexota bacterium]
MNYHLRGDISVILMSLRPNAPYSDRVEDEGRILIYEGHDVPKTRENPIPKIVDQQMKNPSGTLNQNGLFFKAARSYKKNQTSPELVRVYEKLHAGIWVYNGLFKLLDSWDEDVEVVEVNGSMVGLCLNNLTKQFPDIWRECLRRGVS